MIRRACLPLLLAAGATQAQDCVWSQVQATGPRNTYGTASAFHSFLGRVVCVDYGVSAGRMATWSYDGAAWTLANSQGPPVRYWYNVAYDSHRNRLVLFSGRYGSGAYATDTWEWDGSAWMQVANGGPDPRIDCGMVYDSAHRLIVVFGGGSNPTMGVTWGWDGSAWTQLASTGPSPRSSPAMAFDPARARVVLYGGSGNPVLADLWEWDGATWTERPTTGGPGPRSGASLLYDTSRNTLILLGGSNSTPINDSWDLNPITAGWTFRGNGGPTINPAALDPVRARAVVPADDRTWEYDGQATISNIFITQQPVSGQFPPGSTVIISVDAIGTGPLSYAWRRNGVPLVDGGAISGAHEASPTISTAQPVNNGQYDVVIANDCSTVISNRSHILISNAGTQCYPNCDRSTTPPSLNVLDFACFLGAMAAGDTYANCDGSTRPPVLNVLDYMCFVNAFAAGCS